MTGELLSLLRRVEAAGGPVEVNASGEVVFVQLSPRCEVALDLEVDSRQQPRNDALLIHALRQDATQRYVFRHEVDDFTPIGAGYHVRFQPNKGQGKHKHEACAWLLAWLDAFEDKP